MSPTEEGVLNKARDAEDNTIIIHSILRNILTPQVNNITSQYKVMCGCECCISAKIIQLPMITWCYCYLKHLKYISHNVQNRRSGELSICQFENHKILQDLMDIIFKILLHI